MGGEVRVSVVMPVFNGEKYLKEAVESILGQTFKDFEFIIIDDGSTDDSLNILKCFKDRRIKLIGNQKNLGVIDTLNKGIRESCGEYIVRMDADDISRKDRIEKLLDVMDKDREIAACGTWADIIDQNGNRTGQLKALNGKMLNWFFWRPSPIIHPSVMMRKSMLTKVVFDKRFKHAEDYDLWLRLGKKYKIENICENLLYYRVHGQNISITKRDEQLESSFKAFINSFPKSNLNKEEFNKIAFYNSQTTFTERVKLYKKLESVVDLPWWLRLGDTGAYLIRKLIN